jgi:hypothetical protein
MNSALPTAEFASPAELTELALEDYAVFGAGAEISSAPDLNPERPELQYFAIEVAPGGSPLILVARPTQQRGTVWTAYARDQNAPESAKKLGVTDIIGADVRVGEWQGVLGFFDGVTDRRFDTFHLRFHTVDDGGKITTAFEQDLDYLIDDKKLYDSIFQNLPEIPIRSIPMDEALRNYQSRKMSAGVVSRQEQRHHAAEPGDTASPPGMAKVGFGRITDDGAMLHSSIVAVWVALLIAGFLALSMIAFRKERSTEKRSSPAGPKKS